MNNNTPLTDGNKVSSGVAHDEYDDEYSADDRSVTDDGKEFNLKEEMTFEKICVNMVKQQNWNGLIIVSKKHLMKNHTSSWKAFFYYGIGCYKTADYVLAIAAFEKSERIYEDDAQLHYNLSLAYFKVGNY